MPDVRKVPGIRIMRMLPPIGRKIACTVLCITVLLSVSCHTNFSPEVDEEGLYTIILYGSGGGNADSDILDHIQELLQCGSSRRVRIVAQINFSKEIQESQPSIAGTHRVVFGKPITIDTAPPNTSDTPALAKFISDVWREATTKGGFSYCGKVDGNAPIPLYESSNITEFLDWTERSYPSGSYVLITWNQLSGWNARDEKTKGLSYDDNFANQDGSPQCISINELYYGVLNSMLNSRISTIFADGRYTNSMENLTIMSAMCDYVVSSCGCVPTCGGWYSSIFNLFNTIVPDNDAILEAGLRHYCENTLYRFENEGNSTGFDDMTVWKTTRVPEIIMASRILIKAMCEDYKVNPLRYDQIISSLRIFDTSTTETGTLSCPLADFSQFIATLANSDVGSTVRKTAGKIHDLISENCCTVVGSSVKEDSFMHSTATFVDSDTYRALEAKYGNAISNSAFCEATGWNTFLELLDTQPTIDNPHYIYGTR